MKVYKFYKDNCYPCKTITAILRRIDMPENLEIIEINAGLEENKELVAKHSVVKVPTLLFENGKRLEGVKPLEIVQDFITESMKENEISN